MKYYSPKCFENLGVTYYKLAMPGKELPIDEFLLKYCGLVKEMEKTLGENEYIGIHCTHGANRTGYLVCYYMCKEKDIDLEVAIQAFS